MKAEWTEAGAATVIPVKAGIHSERASRRDGSLNCRLRRNGMMAWLASIGLAALLAGCSNPAFDDPFAEYARRSDTISPTAGNAKEANSAVQTIDPWPRYVYNTHIQGDGQRMSEAVTRYHENKPGPRPLPPVYDITTSGVAGTGTGGQ